MNSTLHRKNVKYAKCTRILHASNYITSLMLSLCKSTRVISCVSSLYFMAIYFKFCFMTNKLTCMAATSFSYDSRTFFMISSSAFAQASNEPFTVMVRSGLYRVRSCRLRMESQVKIGNKMGKMDVALLYPVLTDVVFN